MAGATRDEVRVHVDAPPGIVYALVSDVTRMGEWSPETYACEWIGGATGPVVGARFKARNRRGMLRWSNRPVVIAAEPAQEFAFLRQMLGYGMVWRYTMTAEGVGTTLSESYEMLRSTPAIADWVVGKLMGVRDRHADLRDGMRQTLERLATAARQQAGAS